VLIRGLHDATGPGRLTKRLEIGRALNGKSAHVTSGLHLEDDGLRVPKKWIQVSARIGVAYAGPVWAEKPWRTVIDPKWPGWAKFKHRPPQPLSGL
jgi:DNA-3-methyladenine glycosylase